MEQYLLDTNTCIYLFKGRYNIADKIIRVGESNCRISEITVAELKFGVERSQDPDVQRAALDTFLKRIEVVPIFNSLDVYAKEKARLRKAGLIIDDFDLLIGATAVANGWTLVTNNEKHLARLDGIVIENWAR